MATNESKRERPTESSLFGKSTYKLWVLAAILLLTVWLMLTDSIDLKWSAGNLAIFSFDLLDSSSYEDLDILNGDNQRETSTIRLKAG